MTTNMKSDIFNLLKTLLPLTVFFYFVQWYITIKILKIELFYSTASIFIFHFVVTLIVCLLLILIKKIYFEKFGFAFMALSLFKMIAAILFLIPLLKSEKNSYLNDVFSFFIPYFLFLTYELIFAARLLKNNEK